MSSVQKFIKKIENQFLKLHQQREDYFWNTYMGIVDQQSELVVAEKALQEFKTNNAFLLEARSVAQQLPNQNPEALIIKGWLRFFEKNVLESEAALGLLNEIIDLETKIQTEKRNLVSGYHDPKSGDFKEASSNVLAMMVGTEKDEALRKAAYEGLLAIEDFVLKSGYLELIGLRNRFAQSLGYADFMEYKCQYAEDMSKQETFKLIKEVYEGVWPAWQQSLQGIVDKFGKGILQPWNFRYQTTGDLSHEIDPYFPFAKAIEVWVQSFEALGVDYQGATLTLDLLDRKGKYENGFMHGPKPAYFQKEKWHPASINFTANAKPNQIGSGFRAINTLFHEGGHAAHFSNIKMPSPVFSQEYPPTSMALAETQSMFMDALVSDGHWQVRYSKNQLGQNIPTSLIEKSIRLNHPLLPNGVLSLLVVSEFEKCVYEMPPADLTPNNLKALGRDIERKIFGMASARPLLTIPHLLSFDSSATYHGYLFAMFGVAQTRKFFFDKFETIADNPNVAPLLMKHYWNPGNSQTFKEIIQGLTGKPLSAAALIENTILPLEKRLQQSQKRIQIIEKQPTPNWQGSLNCQIKLVHGAELIADNKSGNLSLAKQFEAWISKGHF